MELDVIPFRCVELFSQTDSFIAFEFGKAVEYKQKYRHKLMLPKLRTKSSISDEEEEEASPERPERNIAAIAIYFSFQMQLKVKQHF